MRRFEFLIPIDLFERVKLMAKQYGMPISKMVIHLLEIGYIEFLKQGGKN